MPFNNNNQDVDILSVISVLLGMINVQENRLQSAQNDVQSANDKQAKFLLEAINKQFEEQNNKLDEIIRLLKEGEQNGQHT